MRTLRNILLVIFMFFVQLSFSQNFKVMKDTTAFKEKIAKMSANTKTIESDFTQVKNLSMLAEKITSKGHFAYGGNNLIRWEYSTPYKYTIVINKEKILIKDEHKTQKYDMNSNKIFKEINDVLTSCVSGNIFNSNKFKVAFFESETGYKLELTPYLKAMRESLDKINMYFDKNVTSVIKLEMNEPGGDNTVIDFTNKKLNGSVAAANFILK